MAAARPIDDLAPLCRQAEALAARRKERPTTAHLLLAVASQPTVGSSLLEAHKLTASRLEQGLPGGPEEDEDAVRRAVQTAREIATRTRSKGASSQHVLLALLGDRKFAAYTLIERCGADAARLRMATMQIAIGATSPRRVPGEPVLAPAAPAHRPPPRAQHAVAISVVPKPKQRSHSTPPPESQTIAVPPAPANMPAPAASISRANEERMSLDPKLFPVLSAFGKNLSLAAARGELAPVLGRDEEIERALDVLAKRSANNPVLVGAPGVGKSSIVRGIAARTSEASPKSSDERILVELSAADLHTNGGRGAFAERLSSIQKEVAKASGRVVLVLEDIHAVLGGDFDADAASEVRLALSKGEFPCIGTSTVDDYRRVIEADPTLARRFSAVLVDEPSSEEALEIVRDASAPLAKHHRVAFDEEVLGASIAWSVRYLPGRALPDKALSILDLAGARASRRGQRRGA